MAIPDNGEAKRTYRTVDCVLLHTLPDSLSVFFPPGNPGVCASFRGAVWMGPRPNFSNDDPRKRAHDAATDTRHCTVAPAGEDDAETTENGARSRWTVRDAEQVKRRKIHYLRVRNPTRRGNEGAQMR